MARRKNIFGKTLISLCASKEGSKRIRFGGRKKRRRRRRQHPPLFFFSRIRKSSAEKKMETDFSLSPPIFWLWLFQEEEEEEREALVLFQPCGKSSSSSFFLSISQNLLLLLLFFFIWDSFLSDLGIQFSSRRDRRNATRGMVSSGRGGKAQAPNELPNSFVNSNSCCFFLFRLSLFIRERQWRVRRQKAPPQHPLLPF